jgi:hypothetical protein
MYNGSEAAANVERASAMGRRERQERGERGMRRIKVMRKESCKEKERKSPALFVDRTTGREEGEWVERTGKVREGRQGRGDCGTEHKRTRSSLRACVCVSTTDYRVCLFQGHLSFCCNCTFPETIFFPSFFSVSDPDFLCFLSV